MPTIIKVINNGTEYTFSGSSSGGIPLDAPTNLAVAAGNAQASITWTDPDDTVISGHTVSKWKLTKLVRKQGSAPTSSSDGTVVATFTTRNGHASTAYVDTGLTNGITYYYEVYAVSTGNLETESGSPAKVVPQEYRTMTVKWTEGSTIAFADYEDDAAGMTAGSTDFDDFFGYSLTKVSTDGEVTEEVTQAQSGGAGKLDFSKLSSTSSGDNVMIRFPKRGIKMTKSGSVVTLSITDDPDREADGFNYYAFQSGDINNISATYNQFFMGAFKSVASGSVAKSWGNGTAAPWTNQTQSAACTAAKANNTSLLWNIGNIYQRWQLCAYAALKYKVVNIQSKIGNGVVSGSKTNTGTLLNTNKIDATYGTTANSTTQVRLFGVEDFWGNVHDWIGGMYTNSSKVLYTQLTGYSGAVSGGASTGATIQHSGSNYCLSSIVGNNKAMFAPTATVSNSSYNTYYCDHASVNASCLAIAGGRNSGAAAGLFHLNVNRSATNADDYFGSRLVLLK